MNLKPLSATDVNAFFEFVVPRASGKLPENYYPSGELDERGVISLVAYTAAKHLEASGKDVLLSLLLTGFCMGREFEVWRAELDQLGEMEREFGGGE